MIGNDIVDLELAKIESNWRRPGYLNKIFTSFEQKLINEAKNPTLMVWLLWSMKEASYKIYATKAGIRSFAPTQLACESLNLNTTKAEGTININNELYYTKSEIKPSFIHSLAATKRVDLPKISTAIYTHPNWLINYKTTGPKCVSHHGKYLALIY